MKRVWLLLILAACFSYLSACSTAGVILKTAPSKPDARTALPAITLDEDWQAAAKRALQDEVYGVMPALGDVSITKTRMVDDNSLGGLATVEEISLTAAPDFGESGQSPRDFTFVLLSPKNAAGPVPVIMMETFCPNHAVVPLEGISKPEGDYFDCSGGGILGSIFGYFFGRYITTPPLEEILSRGYAVATTYSSTFVPDRASTALPLLRGQYKNARAIGMWAYQFGAMAEVLEADPRYDATVTFGHSRYGKSALVAAAFYPQIDGVIAHQSGTGGASLSRGKDGETVAQITQSYPHWFSANYTDNNLTIDQHHLLALIAPRPILLGNAKRDVWSDPEGAFIAARGATPAYVALGKTGLAAQRLNDYRPNDDIAFWIRPGTHGIVKEDWPAFLAFMDAHFAE